MPRVHVAPSRAKTYGDIAGRLTGAYGLTPDPWQQLVLDDWLGESGGRWSSLTCGLAVPRQNGKNGLIEMREVFGMVGLGERILHTAHEVKTAQKAFKRLKHFFGSQVRDPGARFPELNRRVVEIRSVNGQEAIVLDNGGSVEIVARSKSSGRGFTVDVLVLDEAQELDDDALEALMPTTSAAPLGNPQWVYTGTPPGPNARGEVFSRVRSDALSGSSARLSWHEWSAEPGVDLDDRSVWRVTNPALATGRLQMPVLEGERARYSDDGFARERLGVWPAASAVGGALSEVAWAGLADPDAPRGDSVVFGVDVDGDRSAWVAVAWRRADGAAQVMLADRERPDDPRPLPAFRLVEECARLASKHGGVVVPPRAFEDEFERAGVPIEPMKQGDFTAACGAFADAVNAGQIRHGNQPALNEAVKAARWRSAGTSGERAFQLKDSPEVGPLAAATRALHGLNTASGGGGWMVGLP